jgi:hypothetical protein
MVTPVGNNANLCQKIVIRIFLPLENPPYFLSWKRNPMVDFMIAQISSKKAYCRPLHAPRFAQNLFGNYDESMGNCLLIMGKREGTCPII